MNHSIETNIYKQNLLSHLGQGANKTINSCKWDLNNYLQFLYQVKEKLGKEEAISIELRKVEDETQKEDTKGLAEKKKNKNVQYSIIEQKNDRMWKDIIKHIYRMEIKYIYTTSVRLKGEKHSDNRIEIMNRKDDEKTITISKDDADTKELILYIRKDDYQIKKQIEALLRLRDEPLKEHSPLLKLFANPNYEKLDLEDQNRMLDDPYYANRYDNFLDNFPENNWNVLTDVSRDGTLEQREFVAKAMCTADFALLEGPPGSGKTTTILELIIQLCKENKKILLVSSTHVAVDNVLKRIIAKQDNLELVAPIRIASDEGQIRYKEVQKYRLQNIVNSKAKGIKKHLSSISNRSESQNLLLDSVKGNNITKGIEEAILEASNLICGTAIGVLQHPLIKESNFINVPFDVMIVDEASKVNFQEFLVPALFAKKWILVGDVKQLSPYVEDENVEMSLEKLLTEDEQEDILKKFYKKKNHQQNKETSWARELAHRLNQYYAFRSKPVLGKHIKEDIKRLCPAKIEKDVRRIQKICMPSILEMLQIGLGQETSNGYPVNKIIYNGVPAKTKKLKFVSLSFQHRMEDIIAQTSRERFYNLKNLKTANTINLRKNPLEDYKKGQVVSWIPNSGRSDREKAQRINSNNKEANSIIFELEDFLKWSNKPNTAKKENGEPFELAILCFYRNQEALVREKLQKLFKKLTQETYTPRKNFAFTNVKVTLCTVDRFQGDEADMVFLSFSKASRNAFYKSPNRLNVALTRARFKLLLFGNRKYFETKEVSEALTKLAQFPAALNSRTSKEIRK